MWVRGAVDSMGWSKTLSIPDELCFDEEDEDEIRDSDSGTPEVFALDSGQLPFGSMGDGHFELLVADVYREQEGQKGFEWYDDARRLNDGADQGRDVILFKDSQPVGVVQCKRVKSIVSRSTIIQELCKFFLYAHIRPQIAAPLGKPFRYIVAVADGAAINLVEFMVSKGRKRFDDLRKEFETRAYAARKKSTILSEHPMLKGLKRSQLADIVWARIDTLETNLHKKDDLSSLVNKHAGIKSTYFRLESDAARITQEIKKLFESRGILLQAQDQECISSIRTEYFQSDFGSHKSFNFSLVQGSELMDFLRGMLCPLSGVVKSNFGSRPVVITAGARAATFADWKEIDDLVKAYPYPLILTVGCGEVSGEQLIAWKESDDFEWVEADWLPASINTFNAGWCWVSHPKEQNCKCFVLVENKPTQTGFDHGNVSLRLAFQDLLVWPTLGGDFTNPITNSRSQLRRLIASSSEDVSKRPNLVLASLDVNAANDVLRAAADYNAQRATSIIGIAMANSGRLQKCESNLCSATGIFPALAVEPLVRASPEGPGPVGRVMRRSGCGALMFCLDWTDDPTLKLVKAQRLVNQEIVDELSPESLEFHELFDRYPPVAGYLPSVLQERNSLNNLIQSGALSDSRGFSYRAYYGIRVNESFTPEVLSASGKSIMRSIDALSFLNVPALSQWSLNPSRDGHVRYDDPLAGEVHIMAWSCSDYAVRDMEGKLFEWARQPSAHPSLIVFADGRGTIRQPKPSHGRYDITSPPQKRGSITDAVVPRSAYLFDLRSIEDQYAVGADLSPEEFMESIMARRNEIDAK